MKQIRRTKRARGVSLIEALVALAVMAFGMLGVVGMQGSLRLNADIAKQRSEAVRIAQEAMENRRAFWILDVAAGKKAYGDIDSIAPVAVAGITSNTTFTLTETVDTPPGGGRTKALFIDVGWADRTGQNQNVRLSTNITGNMPELSGSLGIPALGNPTRLPRGRHAAIPPGAVDQGDGTSKFAPPGGGSLSWVFNNVSGFITRSCAGVVCSTFNARLLSGYVRFATENAVVSIAMGDPGQVNFAAHPFVNGQRVAFSTTGVLPSPLVVDTAYYVVNQASGTFQLALIASGPAIATTSVGWGVHRIGQPTSTMAESPPSVAFGLDVNVFQTFPASSTVSCFESLQTQYVSYFCAVPVEELNGNKWSGRSDLALAPLSSSAADVSSSNYKVCRYTPATNALLVVPAIANTDHPAAYVDVNSSLANQNFLVIRAGDDATAFSCPGDDTSTTSVNGNTLLHQPAG